MLTAWSSEDKNDVRYRRYTSSLRTKQAFERIPKIQFTDTGHGIIFSADQVESRRAPVVTILDKHVNAELRRIMREDAKALRKAGADRMVQVGSETNYVGGMAPQRRTGNE